MIRRFGPLGLWGLAVAALAAMPLLAKDTPPKTDPKAETLHVVQPGETLAGIANRAEVPRVLIIEANRLKAPYAVKAGQKLVIAAVVLWLAAVALQLWRHARQGAPTRAD